MLYINCFAFALLLSLASSQTPKFFDVSTTSSLQVIFPRNVQVTRPGVSINPADTAVAPQLTLDLDALNLTTTDAFMAFMVSSYSPTARDLNSTITNSHFTLLWWQPYLQALPDGTLVVWNPYNLPNFGAPYRPAGDGSYNTVVVVVKQPPNFVVPDLFRTFNPPQHDTARVGFSLKALSVATGLEAPVAGNWFVLDTKTPSHQDEGSTVNWHIGISIFALGLAIFSF